MNFDLDDPLEGLLSDGSNDSLFGNETANKSIKVSKNKTMEELFGINTTDAANNESIAKAAEHTTAVIEKIQTASMDYAKTSTSVHQPSSLSSMQGKKSETYVMKAESSAISIKPVTPQKKEISFDDNDLLADLGFDPKKPKSKSNMLDDILGDSLSLSTKEVSAKSLVGKPKQNFVTTLEEPKTAGKNSNRQSAGTTETLQSEGSIAPSSTTAPGSAGILRRSSRRKSSVSMLVDPLGLFGNTSNGKPTSSELKQHKAKSGPNWLGLNDESVLNEKEGASTVVHNPDSLHGESTILEALKTENVISSENNLLESTTKTLVVQTQPIGQLEEITVDSATITSTLQQAEAKTQGAIATMQQQEFHLSLANQMALQEKALIEMQEKQYIVLKRQEAQFNELLQKQISRQSALEDVLAKQQERINANIHLIMSQTPPKSAYSFLEHKTLEHLDKETPDDKHAGNVEIHSIIKRLEMEKLQLEDMMSNLSSNHEQELSILEASYKKQTSFLEDSVSIMEARMKHDNMHMQEFYKAKLDFIEQEKLKLIADHQAKVQMIEDQHRGSIEMLKQSYDENLEQLRQDHKEMIIRIRESKILEFSVMQENQSYLQALKNASNYLETASGDLQQLRDTLQEQIEFSQNEKELRLVQREKQIEDQQRLIQRSRDAASEENARLLKLVELLESKVTEMSKVSSEERWEYKQKCAKLEAERQGIDKEKQFIRERHDREDARITELKQVQLEEYSRMMEKVAQERQVLLEEKAKLETLAQLQSSTYPVAAGRTSVEVKAALKVAEEAARQADEEKERYMQMQRQMEAKRREIQIRENQLREIKNELDASRELTREKERNAGAIYQTLRKAERNMLLKVQLVQRQFREVSEREDRLAKDKIEFSKERMELQAARRKLSQTRCSLCKIGDKSQELGDILTTNTDSVADDLKLEANFAEMQSRLGSTGLKFGEFFDDEIERQLNLIVEYNQLESSDAAALNDTTDHQERHCEFDADPTLQKLDTYFLHLSSNRRLESNINDYKML
ncbi:fas-binding factor 1 homolog [Anopheles nili]|uniref:fas-binding factor 1 homolog n=1 Tax=Anopheles nili TaxID=185578 RepID=UPI00237A7ED7|nr:fas-binding factor 1 homolog [Anopheles nili]